MLRPEGPSVPPDPPAPTARRRRTARAKAPVPLKVIAPCCPSWLPLPEVWHARCHSTEHRGNPFISQVLSAETRRSRTRNADPHWRFSDFGWTIFGSQPLPGQILADRELRGID